MFVGHAALAFAVVVRLAATKWSRRDALRVGLVAAAFATIPDVDILYAPVGLVGARLDALALASAFWSTSTLVHRGVTHSLVVAGVVGLVAIGCFYAVQGQHSPIAVVSALLGGALVAGVLVDAGGLPALVTALFVVSALGVATVTALRTTLPLEAFALAALVGLLSHPFGDLFTGEPPAFLYPFDAVLIADRVTLSGDPTLHLLGAFAIELAMVWLAVRVLGWGVGFRFRESVLPRVVVAAGYAVSVFFIPPPTLDLSYPFVFSVVSVGLVGAVPRLSFAGERVVTPPDRWSAAVSALAAVTLAWAAYAVAYLVL